MRHSAMFASLMRMQINRGGEKPCGMYTGKGALYYIQNLRLLLKLIAECLAIRPVLRRLRNGLVHYSFSDMS